MTEKSASEVLCKLVDLLEKFERCPNCVDVNADDDCHGKAWAEVYARAKRMVVAHRAERRLN